MSDLAELDLDLDLDPEGDLSEETSGPGARCAKVIRGERCPVVLGPEAHRLQRYCAEHQPQKGKKKGRPAAEPLPPTITIDLGGKGKSKKEDDLAARVEAGAATLLGLAPLVFAAIGDETCTSALAGQIPAIAHQLGELSRFHPGIAKVFAGTDTLGEAGTWIALTIAVLPALVAILVHHGIIKGEVARRAEAAVASMRNVAGGAA